MALWIRLQWSDGKPDEYVTWYLVDLPFGAQSLPGPSDEGGGPADECLIHTPGFRFDWQRGYNYDPGTGPMPVIHRGDQVRVTCKYNNSETNPDLPQHLAAAGRTEPADVYWGEETGDEMCMAIIGLIVPENWSPLSWF